MTEYDPTKHATACRRRRKTPWERIVCAADRGTGLRLSADDVLRLSRDNAIMTRGELDADGEEPGPSTVYDPYDECARCGSWHYTHETGDLSRNCPGFVKKERNS